MKEKILLILSFAAMIAGFGLLINEMDTTRQGDLTKCSAVYPDLAATAVSDQIVLETCRRRLNAVQRD